MQQTLQVERPFHLVAEAFLRCLVMKRVSKNDISFSQEHLLGRSHRAVFSLSEKKGGLVNRPAHRFHLLLVSTRGYCTYLFPLSLTSRPYRYLLNVVHQSDGFALKSPLPSISTFGDPRVSGGIAPSWRWDRSGWAGCRKRSPAERSVKMSIGGGGWGGNVAYESFPSCLVPESLASWRAGPGGGSAGSD